MNEEDLEYIRSYLAISHESLEDARLLLDSDRRRSAVGRCYYASFYAVSALLLTEGMYGAKHSRVHALFQENWMKPERLPRTLGTIYKECWRKGTMPSTRTEPFKERK